METIIGNLSKEQYFELCFLMEKMLKNRMDAKIKEQNLTMMEKDLVIAQLKMALFKQVVKDAQGEASLHKEEYEEFRNKLSVELGYDLKDVIIDPVTLEVKKLQ